MDDSSRAVVGVVSSRVPSGKWSEPLLRRVRVRVVLVEAPTVTLALTLTLTLTLTLRLGGVPHAVSLADAHPLLGSVGVARRGDGPRLAHAGLQPYVMEAAA
eukprot:scaffold76213_cov44-Phaeocystis_antarctica.AAC.1